MSCYDRELRPRWTCIGDQPLQQGHIADTNMSAAATLVSVCCPHRRAATMSWQEAVAAARADAEQLRKQNALLTAEVEGTRDAVSQLLDRISGLQV